MSAVAEPSAPTQTARVTFDFFRTESARKALYLEASRWRGTPFMGNSCSRGPTGGVSCQKLVAALYQACGFGVGLEIPEVPMAHARWSKVSLLDPWMACRERDGLFRAVPLPQASLVGELRLTLRIGDMLGYRISGVVHHCGVYLGQGEVFHVIEGSRAGEMLLADATWSKRLARIWRPQEVLA